MTSCFSWKSQLMLAATFSHYTTEILLFNMCIAPINISWLYSSSDEPTVLTLKANPAY